MSDCLHPQQERIDRFVTSDNRSELCASAADDIIVSVEFP